MSAWGDKDLGDYNKEDCIKAHTPSTNIRHFNSLEGISIKSSMVDTATKPTFHQVSGELSKNLAFLADFKPLEELESDLYDITKDYKRAMGAPKIRLDSIRHFHHLMQMQEHFAEITKDEQNSLSKDIEALLNVYPWAMNEYRWYMKMIGLINILAVKWGLINPHRYAYRNLNEPPSNSIEASENSRRQTMAFTVDTLWLAVTCTLPPLFYKADETSQAFSGFVIARFIQLVRYLISLNFNADFCMYKNIRYYCGLSDYELEGIKVRKKKERIAIRQRGFSINGITKFNMPQYAGLISSEHIEKAKRGIRQKVNGKAKKMRVKLARTIGFHMLDLPANFCSCMNSRFDSVNLKLRGLLVEFEEAYRLFEYSITKHQAVLSIASLDIIDSNLQTPKSVNEMSARKILNELNEGSLN